MAAMIVISACGDKGGSGSEAIAKTVKVDKVFPLSLQKKGYTQDLATIRAQARTLIDHRVQTDNNPLAMMTVGYWHPEFVFNAGKMSDEFYYAGYWIKYNDDFTYQYGQNADVHGGGRYHFRLDDKALLLLDDDVEQEPKSFTANYNGEAMAYIGKHDYGVNNGMQIKMIHSVERPNN